MKMHQGHHGANHPVKDLFTGKVEITSMNHGFAVGPRDLCRAPVERTCLYSMAQIAGLLMIGRLLVQYSPRSPRRDRATVIICSANSSS